MYFQTGPFSMKNKWVFLQQGKEALEKAIEVWIIILP